MAYAKKAAKNEAYQKLKTDLKEGNPLGNAYLFYGEELSPGILPGGDPEKTDPRRI